MSLKKYKFAQKVCCVYILCTLMVLVDVTMGCPKVCECKWKHGKVWVICANANFIDVPQGLDSATQVLDLSKNNLKILFRDAFIDRGLINLQKVFLVNCQLRKIDKHSLRRLANLVELNLAYNLLSGVPIEVLEDIPGLRELRLQRNNITIVPLKAFDAVPELVHLDLSYNSIRYVEETAFIKLLKLEILKLSGNRLTTIKINLLQPLTSLYELHLHANLWDCNCVLRPVIELTIGKNFASSAFPKCWTPSQLRGKFWREVEPDKLVCVPKVTPLASRVLAMNGDNVTLTCKIETEADAKITWMVKNKHLTNETHPLDDQRYNVLEMVTIDRKNQTTVSNLTISQADFDDEGIYRCVVENDAGRVETNLTLQVSEAIKEDQLVANDDDYLITGAILGGVIAFVTLGLVLCVSLIIYKRKSSQMRFQRKNVENASCQLKHEYSTPSPITNMSSPKQKCSCPKRKATDSPSVFIYKNNENPSFVRSDNQFSEPSIGGSVSNKSGGTFLKKLSSLNTESSSLEKGNFDISFVEIPEVPIQFQDQPNTSRSREVAMEGSSQFPDVLSHQTPAYCTLYRHSQGSSTFDRSRSSIKIAGGSCSNQQGRPNLQSSRSSTCLHSNDETTVSYPPPQVSPFLGGHIQNPIQDVWTVRPSYSLESLQQETFPHNRIDNLQIPGDVNSSTVCINDMCSTPLHGVQCGINSIQLQRILQEYNYMKEELHRLKEAQKERDLHEKRSQDENTERGLDNREQFQNDGQSTCHVPQQ